MNAQGSSTLNLAVFANLTAAALAAPDADALQAMVNTAFGSLAAVQGAMVTEQAALEPIQALLVPPTANLANIVTWLTSFIEHFLVPIAAPALTYPTQIALFATEVTALTAAIHATASARFPGAVIQVPSIPGRTGIDPPPSGGDTA